MIGPNKQLTNDSRNDQVNKDVSIISQLIVQAVKKTRHVNYEAKPGLTRALHTPETHKTRSSTILDILSNLRLPVSYKKICKIKYELVETEKAKMKENGGVYIAPNISVNKPLYFAIDRSSNRHA